MKRQARVNQTGSASVELALAAPILLLGLLLLQLAWRTQTTNGDVDFAAGEAARAASLQATSGSARSAAISAVNRVLAGREVSCTTLRVDVDGARFARGGSVTVSVRCTADLGDLTLLGVPGSFTATGTATEIIDTHRGGA